MFMSFGYVLVDTIMIINEGRQFALPIIILPLLNVLRQQRLESNIWSLPSNPPVANPARVTIPSLQYVWRLSMAGQWARLKCQPWHWRCPVLQDRPPSLEIIEPLQWLLKPMVTLKGPHMRFSIYRSTSLLHGEVPLLSIPCSRLFCLPHRISNCRPSFCSC